MIKDTFRPRIGIVPDITPDKKRVCVSKYYSEALFVYGSLPFILPYHPNFTVEDLRLFARGIDGILLTGSDYDVDPKRFGQKKHDCCGPILADRDNQDFLWIELAQEFQLPILAICYGCQVLAVYYGGGLHQDIQTNLTDSLNHKPHTDAFQRVHPVRIVKNSYLDSIFDEEETWVNSSHHQAVDALPQSFRVDAYAPDGIIEAFSYHNMEEHWVLGIQWHPEYIHHEEPLSQKIFESFVNQARLYGRKKTQ